MGIYRGPGGTGDAINDASSEATLVSQLVTQAQESEANASTSATAAANSASAASTSAANAATAETNAETAEANAETAETNAETAQAAAEAAQAAAEAAQLAAETAETNAETAETNAETAQSAAATSATNAASSASTATTQATNASNSASAAATSATNASNSASASATSATNAASSATSAAGSATTATTQASNASTSASNAATSETNAAGSTTTATTQAGIATTQASNAATSATNAASSATAASTSASNASTSATSAANAQSAAETARDQTLAAFDSFDDRYLGQKATAPTVDNDGNALVAGALYFNTTTNEMKVYDGTQWLNAYASLSGALIATSNLSDLNDVSIARTNLGLGSAATTASTDYATAAQGTKADNALTAANPSYTGTLTGGTGVVNLGSGQFYKDASGNVGIGTSSPTAKLTLPNTVDGTGGTVSLFRFYDVGTGAINGLGTSASSFDLRSVGNFVFYSGTTPAERMRIDSAGNVGIGTDVPLGTLDVAKSTTSSISIRSAGSGVSSYLVFKRARGTIASPTAASGSAVLSNIVSDGFDGTNYVSSSVIATTQTGTISTGVVQSYTAFSNANASGVLTERLRINELGDVGIGTTSPSSKLTVASSNVTVSAGYGIAYAADQTRIFTPEDNVSGGLLQWGSGGILRFNAGSSTERMRIDSSGNVGIGTSSPATRLQIESSASNTRAKVVSALSGSLYYSGIEFSRTSTLGGALIETARNATYGGVGLAFSTTADNAAETAGTYTERMRIHASGGMSIGNTTDPGASNLSVTGSVTASSFSGAGTGLTGTAASLSIGGNAATATSANNIDGIAFKNASSSSTFAVDTEGVSGIGYSNGYTLFGQSDGGVYCSTHSSAWQHQINGDFRTGQIAIRGKNNGTWQAWRTVLDSSNYTSYSPSLTGSGASGTWGINVTGSAATATLATKSSTLAAGGGNGTAMTFNWSGVGGQPPWLWGGTDGANMYVYNPSNFSVNYATTAGNGVKAWVNFNGSGTVAIRASSNVSSITDNGTGVYTVNFTTAFSDVNYAAVSNATWESSSGTNVGGSGGFINGTRTTSAYQVKTINPGSNAVIDSVIISVAFFR